MTKKAQLLKAAEGKVRTGGYNNFSFRELAADVGIKSASVHYHFPTKEDLGAELARQYTDTFMNALGDPMELTSAGKNPIEIYTQQFRSSLLIDKKMCLCGLLGAESDSLPNKVRTETKRFFSANIAWLEQAHAAIEPNDHQQAKINAVKTVSLLEGAMMISKTLDDVEIFNLATNL
jgi:TetR/AcrR family transcriptional repressor of nem operon